VRALALPVLLAPLMLAASAPAQPAGEPLNVALERAHAEQAAAEREAGRLEQAASHARGEAQRMAAEQAAAAQDIEVAEARITSAQTGLQLAAAYVAAHRSQLAQEERPVASLLAGLAVMAQRPPLLALADGGGSDELVKVRILLDATLPIIRSRTARLSSELVAGQRIEVAAAAARTQLMRNREDLVAKRQQFATLERRALDAALAAGGQALGAGDIALAAGEDVERLRNSEADQRISSGLAAGLAAEGPAPPRPASPDDRQVLRPPFAYQLPVVADVTAGLASVSTSGVRSRGLTLATRGGAPVVAPAAGIVRFSGPFQNYDGILILDHGNGWMSVLVNLSSQLAPGARVRIGDPVGRALGPLQVELSQNGRIISPALIAGSSQTLSNIGKGR
jgi:murein hydrolase activator